MDLTLGRSTGGATNVSVLSLEQWEVLSDEHGIAPDGQ